LRADGAQCDEQPRSMPRVSVMLARTLAIALNTYREAVRARLLLGVLALALATSAYSLVVATLSLRNETRVVADLGAASLSLYAVTVAILLGSTSLYRELEHRTIFPILSRPIRRWEYLLGKYLGTLLTVGAFVAIDASVILATLALESGQPPWRVLGVAVALLAVLGVALWQTPGRRVYVLVPWALAAAAAMWVTAQPAFEERQLVAASAVLSVCEVAIVAAFATLCAAFTSPFLTATFTAMVFVIGRSADTLAHFPARVFGQTISRIARGLSHVVPNLHIYVPARALLLGKVAEHPVWPYVGTSAAYAAGYATVLLVLAAIVFRHRDFA
jgi:ABC-type transport system involved in multi-copper enzyme maturation permease subunit